MARPQKLNLDYFSHDNNMRNNRKIKALRTKFGLEGYAVFNMLLETLAEKDCLQIDYNEKELELLAGDFNIQSEKLSEIIEYLTYLELLKLDKNKLLCPSLDKRSKLVFDKRMEFLTDLRQKNGVSDTETGVSVIKSTQSKVKYSKVNNNKLLLSIFEDFRNQYSGTKRGLEIEFENFKNKHKDWEAVLPILLPALNKEKSYKDILKSQGRFCPEWKNLKTWLNQKCWEQEFESIKTVLSGNLSNNGQKIKSKVRKQLEELPEFTVVMADGHKFVKDSTNFFLTENGVVSLSDFEKNFKDFIIRKQEK